MYIVTAFSYHAVHYKLFAFSCQPSCETCHSLFFQPVGSVSWQIKAIKWALSVAWQGWSTVYGKSFYLYGWDWVPVWIGQIMPIWLNIVLVVKKNCEMCFCISCHIHYSWHLCFFIFLPEASFGLRVLSLPASVCVCVRMCASTLSLSAR